MWQITDEDPKEAARSHRTVDQIMDCLPDDGLSSSLWLEACRERFQITDKAFETLRPMARKQDRCHFSQVDGKWKPTVSELEKRKAALTASEDDE